MFGAKHKKCQSALPQYLDGFLLFFKRLPSMCCNRLVSCRVGVDQTSKTHTGLACSSLASTRCTKSSKKRVSMVSLWPGWFNKLEALLPLRLRRRVLQNLDAIVGVREGVGREKIALNTSMHLVIRSVAVAEQRLLHSWSWRCKTTLLKCWWTTIVKDRTSLLFILSLSLTPLLPPSLCTRFRGQTLTNSGNATLCLGGLRVLRKSKCCSCRLIDCADFHYFENDIRCKLILIIDNWSTPWAKQASVVLAAGGRSGSDGWLGKKLTFATFFGRWEKFATGR